MAGGGAAAGVPDVCDGDMHHGFGMATLDAEEDVSSKAEHASAHMICRLALVLLPMPKSNECAIFCAEPSTYCIAVTERFVHSAR